MELRRYWEIILKRKWVLALAVFIVPLFAFMFMKIVSPVYYSYSKLWIKLDTFQQSFIKDVPSGFGKFDFTDKSNAMGTIEEMLESDGVILKVITELGLKDKDGEFLTKDHFVDPSSIGIILGKKGVNIENVADSDTFKIIGYSDNPKEAQQIAAGVIKRFVENFSKVYRDTAEKAIEVLKKRVLEVGKNLSIADRDMIDYKIKNKMYDLSSQRTTLIAEISNLESEQNKTDRNLGGKKESLKSIKTVLSAQPEYREGSTTLEKNPVVSEAKKQLLITQLNMAKLSSEVTTEHPEVKALQQQADSAKEVILKEVEKTFSTQIKERNSYYDNLIEKYGNAEIDIVTDEAIKQRLESQIKERKEMLKLLTTKEDELNRLSREVEILKNAYNSLMANLETAVSAKELDIANAIVIQPPVVLPNLSNVYFPPVKKTVPMILSVFIATFLGVSLIFLLEYLDETIESSEEVKMYLGQDVIEILPVAKKKYLDISKGIQSNQFTDAVYNLLSKINLAKGPGNWKVISIVSPSKGEGKSIITACIGALMGGQGKKTLMIDGNLRAPALHRIFKLDISSRLSDYISGKIPARETVIHTQIENLDIITDTAVHPQGFLSSERFKGLIDDLLPDYDVILI
ncbi:MAG: polysaccharide biosynthesis tyrosine autokinase, partial [Nitrospirae bacterium]|nr:polysaccharide biosynthesis tyrosine autokinase [Nitrospirota bacterium]